MRQFFIFINLLICFSTTAKNYSIDSKFKKKSDLLSLNYLNIKDTTLFKGKAYIIPVKLVNNEYLKAIQFDLNIPEGFNFDLNSIEKYTILDNFSISTSSLGNNKYRFIIYTFGDNNIPKGDNNILKLPVFIEDSIELGEYSFEFSNIILSNKLNQNITSQSDKICHIKVIEDNIIPEITIIGNLTVSIELESIYKDFGATAYDNFDGDITSKIISENNVDTTILGSYQVTYNVSDSNGNSAKEVKRVVNVESSLSTIKNINKTTKIYPNLTKKYWTIESAIILDSIKVYDVFGRIIFFINPKSQFYKIDGSQFSNGIYFLVINGKNITRVIKV